MLSTPTASGKSLAYNVPVLHAMATDAAARALYVFPTKALAHDQLRAFRGLCAGGGTSLFGLRVDTYDGDTPHAERQERRDAARVIITNPDMLHCAVLPAHKEWREMLANLRYVVIDEAHMYRGAFGAHVACILRRLRRLASLHGGSPSFVCCSATLGNPQQLFTHLTGLQQPLVITQDGSPHGRRRLLLWNPPLALEASRLPPDKGVPLSDDEAAAVAEQAAASATAEGRRMSPNIEAAVLFAEFVRSGLKTICFCSVRKICELVLDYTRQHLRAQGDASLADRVTAYRGGLNADDRRRIERDLYEGTLRGVTATSSLELGVDIASLDAVVLVGFPGSVSAMWQRAGRGGRSADSDALCVLVAYPSAIDQWCIRNPQRLLQMPLEAAVIDTDNPLVLQQHLLCASAEEPLSATMGDAELFGETGWAEGVQALAAAGRLLRIDESDGWRNADGSDFVPQNNIRSIEPELISVIDLRRRRPSQQRLDGVEPAEATEAEVIDEVESWRIYYELFEGAVYMNQGRKFLVQQLDLRKGVAYAQPSKVQYYTRSLDTTDVTVLQRISTATAAAASRRGETIASDVHYGRVRVTLSAAGYVKIWQRTGEVFEELPLSLPPRNTDSRACWVDLPTSLLRQFAEAAHAMCGAPQPEAAAAARPSEAEAAAEPAATAGEARAGASASRGGTAMKRARAAGNPKAASGGAAAQPFQLDAGLHAAAHAVLAVLPLHLSCGDGDICGECSGLRERRVKQKRLLLYDRCEGGLGIAKRLQPVMPALLKSALQLATSCPCEDGCWCCVHSSKCLEYNMATSKRAAIFILEGLLQPPVEEPPMPMELMSGCDTPATEEEAPEDQSMMARSIRRFRRLLPDHTTRLARQPTGRSRESGTGRGQFD